MIKKLNFSEDSILSAALILQKESYEVEAGLIGSRNIPPLHETAEQLGESDEKFIGYYHKNILAGFIAVEEETPYLRISRLVVSPEYFRRGIGKTL
ncbi:MAG: GNAT family N-acetyltransferase, partial [Pseudobdellovibrio sp.]